MKYSTSTLIEKQASGEQLEYIFFWGHTVHPEITKTCFSQWYPSPFKVEGVVYATAEHWMMAQKAKLFNDLPIWEKIIEADSPAEAKKLGRLVKNFDNDIWKQHRFQIVVEGNQHKFSQNENLRTFLQQTGNRVLVEASPVDPIWGIGLAQGDKGIENPALWRGLNLLGFTLMEVRDQL